MEVELLHYSPIELAAKAARKCTATRFNNMDDEDKRVLSNVSFKGHTSVIEHIVYTFDIPVMSRAVLQEMARHRIASPTVQSTRFTLGKMLLRKNMSQQDFRDILHQTGDEEIDELIYCHLAKLKTLMEKRKETGHPIKNDIAKYALPEAFLTTMQWTINARSLSNFLNLRTVSGALQEIQDLANAVIAVIPEDHQILYPQIFGKVAHG